MNTRRVIIANFTEKQLEEAKTQARNMRLPQNPISFNSSIFFSSVGSYFLPKNSVCVAMRTAVRADMHANALTPIRGLVVIFVARLKADLALMLSKKPPSVKPAVLGSANPIKSFNPFN